MEVRCQLHAPAALLPEKEPPTRTHCIGGWAGVDPVLTTWETGYTLLYRDSNSDPPVVQPVASGYTDCAILAHIVIIKLHYFM
jgi:hypothetical protein